MKKYIVFSVIVSFLFALSFNATAGKRSYSSSSFKSSSFKSSSYRSSSYKPSKSVFDRKSTLNQKNKKEQIKKFTEKKVDSKKKTTNKFKTENKAVKNKIATTSEKKSSLDSRKKQERVRAAKAKVKKKQAKDLKKYQDSIKKDKKSKNLTNMSTNKYHSSREDFFESNNVNRPIVINNTRDSYGIWDSIFMWSILSNLNNNNYSSAYYHNMHTEEFREWRKEAEELAKENEELREQLNQLDSSVEKMKSNGVAVKEGSTGDLPQYVYAAEDALTLPEVGVLNVGIASKEGMYNEYCKKMKNNADNLVINCYEDERGSVGIMAKVMNKEINAGFVQSDVFLAYGSNLSDLRALQSNIADEYVYLVTSKDSNISSISDFENDTKNKLYSMGSGSRFTMNAFYKIDQNYKKAYDMASKNRLPVDFESFKLISRAKDSAVVFVCSLNCPIMSELNESELGKKLKLVSVNDWDFNNKKDKFGNLVYEFKDLTGDNFGNLIPSVFGMTGSIETISLKTVFVVNEEWFKYNEKKSNLEVENLIYDIKEEF